MKFPALAFISTILIKLTLANSASDFDIEAFRKQSQMKAEQKPIVTDYGKGCAYTCKNGAVPTPKKNYVHYADGCGIDGNMQGFEWDDKQFRFKDCCNDHDLCYGVCNKPKTQCDKAFSTCMDNWCKRAYYESDRDVYENCTKRAQMISSTTKLFACGMFQDAQRQACECNKPTKAKVPSVDSSNTSRSVSGEDAEPLGQEKKTSDYAKDDSVDSEHGDHNSKDEL